MLKCRS